MNHQLLSPYRVVESSAFIAAPLAGLTLAQFGADVIRVDMVGGGLDQRRMPCMPDTPDGPGRSLYWTGLNKGKRSVAVDLRRPEGRALVQDLVLVRMRGAAAAIFSLVMILTSSGLGPYWAGKISTITGSLTMGLYSLLAFVPVAAVLLLLASRRMRSETPEARRALAAAAGEGGVA